MKPTFVTLALLVALACIPAVSAGEEIGDCNGDHDVACFYDHDGDSSTAKQLCLVWAPSISTTDGCLVGG